MWSIFKPQLIESFGYPVEEHQVVTEDGYILTLHRIPAQTIPGVKRPPPVFLGHCLVGSSAIWVFGPPDNSLAFMLSDAGKNRKKNPAHFAFIFASFTPIGYDVWMINIRGNSYSKNHQWLDVCPTCSEFWAFGFDESARYDYPATIGKIV